MKMTPYERLMAVLSGRKGEIDRLPAINSVGTYTVDSMKAFNAYWPNAHKDPEKMARLAAGLHKLAGLDNVTLPFELTFEAEVFGAPLDFFEGKIKWPTVKRFIAHVVSDLQFPKDVSIAGRVPIVTKAIRILKKEFEGKIPIIAYINCPFTSIGSYLVEPTEFLKYLRIAPEEIHEFYKETYPYYAEIANTLKEAGADVITYREESVSLDNVSPKHFDEFVKPYLTKMVGLTKPPRILHICGQCVSGEIEIVGRMIECGAEAITIEKRTPMRAAREIADRVKPSYPIGGNINPYAVIHEGSVEMIRATVKEVIEDGVDMVAPGCDFWLETPTEHVKAFVDAVIEFGTPPPWAGGK
jgi:[methyl-Co(III) methanol-specific corrinoid protein]:coenzyme M methyltransferase